MLVCFLNSFNFFCFSIRHYYLYMCRKVDLDLVVLKDIFEVLLQ